MTPAQEWGQSCEDSAWPDPVTAAGCLCGPRGSRCDERPTIVPRQGGDHNPLPHVRVIIGCEPRVRVAFGGTSISPMITSMKLTHKSVPFKHSVARLYIAAFSLHAKYSYAVLTWGDNLFSGGTSPLYW